MSKISNDNTTYPDDLKAGELLTEYFVYQLENKNFTHGQKVVG